MDTGTVVLIAFFSFLVLGFVAGLFFFPELFGISKKSSDSRDDDLKPQS